MAKSILICDDAAFMRMMIKDILSKNGYNIAGEAENGVKAIEKYKDFGGVRIEDDVLITDDGARFLGKDRIPYHADDVEKYVAEFHY